MQTVLPAQQAAKMMAAIQAMSKEAMSHQIERIGKERSVETKRTSGKKMNRQSFNRHQSSTEHPTVAIILIYAMKEKGD